MYIQDTLEIFKIRMYNLLGKNKKPNESFIEKSILGLTSGELRNILDWDFRQQSEIMDKRLKLLHSMFHKELNEPWLSVFNSYFTSYIELQKINPNLAEKLQENTITYSAILEAFYSWVDSNGFFEKKPMGAKSKAEDELKVYVELFKDFFNYIEALYAKITPIAEKKWASRLTRFDEDCTLKNYNLIVSLGFSDWFQKRNNVVSASYITGEHSVLYQSDTRKFGWCFDVNKDNIIGMCPYDFNSNLLDDLELTSLELYKAAFAGAEFTKQLECFRTNYAEFLRWYKPDDLIDSTKEGTYNEIILKGNSPFTEPKAVFVSCDMNTDNYLVNDKDFRRASTVANLYSLPLAVFSESNKTIRIIKKPEILA